MVERSVQSGPTWVNRRRVKRDAPCLLLLCFCRCCFFFPFLVNFPRALLTILFQEFRSRGQRKEDVSRKKKQTNKQRGDGVGVRALSLSSSLSFSPSLPSYRTPLSERLEQAVYSLLVNSCVPPPPLKDRWESLRGGENCTQAKKNPDFSSPK